MPAPVERARAQMPALRATWEPVAPACRGPGGIHAQDLRKPGACRRSCTLPFRGAAPTSALLSARCAARAEIRALARRVARVLQRRVPSNPGSGRRAAWGSDNGGLRSEYENGGKGSWPRGARSRDLGPASRWTRQSRMPAVPRTLALAARGYRDGRSSRSRVRTRRAESRGTGAMARRCRRRRPRAERSGAAGGIRRAGAAPSRDHRQLWATRRAGDHRREPRAGRTRASSTRIDRSWDPSHHARHAADRTCIRRCEFGWRSTRGVAGARGELAERRVRQEAFHARLLRRSTLCGVCSRRRRLIRW